MAFCSPSRSADQLIKSRNAALKLKYGSPQFRDVIRQRCRRKVKENRQKFVDLLRTPSGIDELNKVLADTIDEELMVISNSRGSPFEITNESYIDKQLEYLVDTNESDLSEKDGIEILDAEVDQIMQSYDDLVANDLNISDPLLDDDFIGIIDCPVCTNGQLYLTENEILCTNCDIKIYAQTSLVELQSKIQLCSVAHSNLCRNKLIFFSNNNVLQAGCHVCSHHAVINF